jgi:2-polyprenyl-6-methoxyphenol hydroxylase-like FAD-dependent oxidoreductase
VRSCVRDGLGGWLVEADSPHGKRKVQARFLVNATGRSTLPQGGQVPPRRASDKLIALVSVAPALTPESRTLIEACENGWWYAAAVPGSSMVLAYLTDADLLPRGSAAAEWERQLVQTSQIRLLIAPAAGFTWIRRVAANSYIRHPVVGRDHVAVGDAATAFDPLSGRGILNALESGRAAALAIESALSGDFAGLDAFAHQVEQGFQIHEESRGHYYSREHRWPDSVFWRRRRPAAMGGTA